MKKVYLQCHERAQANVSIVLYFNIATSFQLLHHIRAFWTTIAQFIRSSKVSISNILAYFIIQKLANSTLK